MSDTPTPEPIAELRALFRSRSDHHPSCSSRHTGGCCDCYAQQSQRAHNLLDAIAEEATALRAERDAALAEVTRLKEESLAAARERGRSDATIATLEAENTRLRGNLEVTEKHYAELADFVERTPREEQARELMRLRNLLARAEVDERWRPIATAPKDGRNVLALHLGYDDMHQFVAEAWFDGNWWMFAEDPSEAIPNEPTHWRHLPLSPADESELERLRQAVAMEETP